MRFFSYFLLLLQPLLLHAQPDKAYDAGFKTISIVDTSRIYLPNSAKNHRLHFRPIDIDFWYPAHRKGSQPMQFEELLNLYEERSGRYREKTDFRGIAKEMAEFYSIESGIEPDGGKKLMATITNSYRDATPAKGKAPLVIYMASFNSMGYENYRLLEELAENGYAVLSIASVGIYPGYMTENLLDLIEQVNDAVAATEYLRNKDDFQVDLDNIGVVGCSWGGLAASFLPGRLSNIKAMVSLDGSDLSSLITTGTSNALNSLDSAHVATNLPVLKMQSDDFERSDSTAGYRGSAEKTGVFHLVVKNSKHEHFICIPAVLNSSGQAAKVYATVLKATRLFINQYLNGAAGFNSFYTSLSTSQLATNEPKQSKQNSNHRKIRGKVVNAISGIPLPYVNVGFINRQLGTVTNSAGTFEIDFDPDGTNDTLRISMIGYETKIFSAGDLRNFPSVIRLAEKAENLSEVVVRAKKPRSKVLGNKNTFKFFSTPFPYMQLGAELGIKVEVPRHPVSVNALNFKVNFNTISCNTLFRLNIYKVKDGKPGANLLTENIFIPIAANQTGIISTDLKTHNIVLNEDVFVSLEWVSSEGEIRKGEGIYFALGLFNGGAFVRPNSQGKIKKHSNLGIGFTLDVNY